MRSSDYSLSAVVAALVGGGSSKGPASLKTRVKPRASGYLLT
jgi:hypothetical protein